MNHVPISFRIFLGVFALLALPLAFFFWYALLSVKTPAYFGIPAAYVIGIFAAATGWFLVYFGTSERKFGVLEGLASSIVAWVVFCLICGFVGKLVFAEASWVLAGAVFAYGLLLFPTWLIFLGGALAGWVVSKRQNGAR